MNLRQKVGPFPLWLWLIAGAIVGWIVYRHVKGSSGSSGQAVQTQQILPQTSDQSALGSATQAGSPSDSGQTTADFLQALGAENTNLLSALETTQTNVIGLAQSQIAAAQTQTSLGSFNQNTQPVAGVEPNSNAPQVVYVMPQVASSPNPTPAVSPTPAPTIKSTVTSTIKPSVTRYYTYKRDVPLGPGQTVHFTSGRGYYAA